MKILGDAIELRTVITEDVSLLVEWENDPATRVYTIDQTPYSEEDMMAFIDGPQDIHSERQLRWMIVRKENKQAIGTLDLFDYNSDTSSVGVGILIYDPMHRKKGYAYEAMNLLIQYAPTYLGVKYIFCNIQPDNKNSIVFFKKIGFTEANEQQLLAFKEYKIQDMCFYILHIS